MMRLRHSLILCCLVWLCALTSLALSPSLSHSPKADERVKVARPGLTVYLPLGSGLPYLESQMWLDGQDVSERLQRTAAFVSYQPPRDLAAGAHTVRFKLGGQELSWDFFVELPPSRIKRISWTGPKNLQDFDEIKVEMEGPPGCQASFRVEGVGQPLELKEAQPGVYRGSYTVPPNVAKVSANLVGTLKASGFEESKSADTPLRFSTSGFRVQLISPEQGEPVFGDFHLKGRTRPDVNVNAKIQMEYADGIEIVSDKTGPLPKPRTAKLRSQKDGTFVVDVARPTIRQKLILNLSLEAEDADGNLSEPLLLHYRLLEKVPGTTYPKWD